MKRIILFALVFVCALIFKANAQESTVNEKLSVVNDKVDGLTERLATDEADLQKLAKIKVSGYMQAQWQNFENLNTQPTNFFSLKRARVKFTYEASDGVKFVLQPDFSPGAVNLREAYVVLNDRWTKTLSLWAGKFNRPNYEVEYSSGQLENLERSLMIRTYIQANMLWEPNWNTIQSMFLSIYSLHYSMVMMVSPSQTAQEPT